MARPTFDQANNEQWSTFLFKLNQALDDLYGATGADVAADLAAINAAIATHAAATASGEATSAALTTAAGVVEALTITDAKITANSKVFVSIKNGTNAAGIPVLSTVTPGAGSAAVGVLNADALAAFNGTLKLEYFIVV